MLKGISSKKKNSQKNIYNWISYQNTYVLTPKNSTPLYFSTDFYHNTEFNFYTYQWDNWPRTRVTFNQKWIRVWNWNQIFSWAWISVAWAVAAWNTAQNNYIYIYATWENNDTNKRFEIFGNQKLAVWTSGGSYIYFEEKDGTTNKYRVGINTTDPKATLDVKGGIRVWSNCEQRTCSSTNKWTIIYYDNNFLGCKPTSNGYRRVSLDGWNISTQELDSETNCIISTYAWSSLINSSTQQQALH